MTNPTPRTIAGGEAPSSEGASCFWQAADDYHGALVEAEGVRLAISPNGKRYLYQARTEAGDYGVRRHRNRLSKLVPDLPEAITSQGLDHLPDDPSDYSRPWAAETEALRERVRAAHRSHEAYAGVIACDGPVRLIWQDDPARYALQVRSPEGWRSVVTSQGASRLCDVVYGRVLPDSDRRAPCVGVRAFKAALSVLPAEASAYRGPRPERIAQVAVQRPSPSRSSGERRAVSTEWLQSAGERPHRRAKALRASDPRKAETATTQAHKRAQGQS